MNRHLLVTALVATAALGSSFAASAQTTAASTTQRDVKQAQRIEMTRIAQNAGGTRRIGRDAAQLLCIRLVAGHSGQGRGLVDSQFERARFA